MPVRTVGVSGGLLTAVGISPVATRRAAVWITGLFCIFWGGCGRQSVPTVTPNRPSTPIDVSSDEPETTEGQSPPVRTVDRDASQTVGEGPGGTGVAEGVLPKPLRVKLNDRASCLAFASDGKMFAIGGSDTVALVDPANGQAIRTIRDPGILQPYRNEKRMRWIKSIAFSPDGKTLAVASDLGVKLWDVAEAREVATLFGHGKPGVMPHQCDAHCVMFSPDGKTVATSRRWAIELWHLDKQVVRELTHGCGGLAFAPDGKILATAEYHNRVHLWDVASGRQLAEDHPQMGILRAAAFSPDGRVLVALSECSVTLWDVRVTSAGHELSRHPIRLGHGFFTQIHSLAYSPDGKTLATGGGGLAKLWEVATGRELATVDRSARCVALSPDGRTLAVGGAVLQPGPVSEVRLWEVAAVLKPEVLAARAKKAAADLVEGLQAGSAKSKRGRDEKSLGNALFALGPHSEAAVPLLIESLDDPRADVRRQICFALGRIGSQNEYVMSALIEAVEDESSEVRRAALSLLGQMARDDVEMRSRVQEAVTHARSRMETAAAEPSAVVRRDGKTLCDGRTVREWIALLGQHYVPNEIFGRSGRGRPAEAIRVIGPTEAVPAMIEALTEEKWRMRVGAADGLGMFGADAKSAIPALVQAVEDKTQQVRHLAARSLGEISSSVGAEPTAALLKLLEHEDASVQLAAARAVLGINADHEPAIGLLKDALAGLLRPGAAARFGLEGPEEAFEAASEEPEPEEEPRQPIREVAVIAYGPRHELAMEAMTLLRSAGARAAPAVPELIEILCSDDVRNTNADDFSRRAAAETLGQIGPAAKGAIPAMIQALKDPEHGVRGTASRNLAKLSPEAVPAQLMDLMDDPDADCRRAAHWALRHFGKVGVAVLVDRLGHKDPKARIAALESLNSLPNSEADFAVVEKALDDDDPEVRLVAVEKVWMSSNGYASRALAALSKVAEDEDPRVREAAALRRRQIEERMRLGRVSTVGQAMWKQCEVHGSFPPAASRDEEGKPLLSWRVALLPYLGEQALFDQFDHDQPWDSPHNLKLLDRIPEMYCPLGRKKDGKTTLMVFVGDGAPLGGREPVSMADFTDDPSETIMLVEAGTNKAVPWTKPEDIAFDSRDPMAALGAIPEEGLVAVFFSQRAGTIPKDIDLETLAALVTYRGGEKTDFWQAADRRRRLEPDAKPAEPKPPVPFQFTPAPRFEAHREMATEIIHSTTERDTARWVLEVGGRVTVSVDGKTDLDVNAIESLPTKPLKLRSMFFGGSKKKIDVNDLERLAGLSHLQVLRLEGLDVTDFQVGWLEDLKDLHVLRAVHKS